MLCDVLPMFTFKLIENGYTTRVCIIWAKFYKLIYRKSLFQNIFQFPQNKNWNIENAFCFLKWLMITCT